MEQIPPVIRLSPERAASIGDAVEMVDLPDPARLARLDAHIAGFCAGIGFTALVLIVGPAVGALVRVL